MASRGLKTGLLILTLAIPVGLYLFLQSFGDNQYTVPVLYESGIADPLTGCPATTSAQLPDFSFKDGQQQAVALQSIEDRLNVFSWISESCDPGSVIEAAAQVANDYRNDARVVMITVPLDSLSQGHRVKELRETYDMDHRQWDLWRYQQKVPNWVRCGFRLEIENCNAADQFILVDGQSRIRGVYPARDKKEVDRLITEIEILLRNREDL